MAKDTLTHHKLKQETLEKRSALVDEFGFAVAAKKIGIKKETLRRQIRELRRRNGENEEAFDDNIIRQLKERYSVPELKRLVAGSYVEAETSAAVHDFEGEEITFGVITDTHLGSKYSDPAHLEEAFEVFDKNGASFILHAGDVFEGLSHRPGHMYECTHLGYSQQLDYGREVFSQWKNTPIYMVDGNHDRWYVKSNGALIVSELCAGQDNLHFLGHDEGDVEIGGVKIKLWHGEDGSSYAFSYRIQKIVESMTGGEKPNILVCGHTHKSLYMFDRHVHCISAGSMQKQSKWMRGKRHASHTGFYVVNMAINDTGVAWFEPRFYPFYQ